MSALQFRLSQWAVELTGRGGSRSGTTSLLAAAGGDGGADEMRRFTLRCKEADTVSGLLDRWTDSGLMELQKRTTPETNHETNHALDPVRRIGDIESRLTRLRAARAKLSFRPKCR